MQEGYESFTPEQEAVIQRYVTNTRSPIFALRNLPEVVKGALFSRYSRSTLGLRSLLLKEFILNQESSFQEIVDTFQETQHDANKQHDAAKHDEEQLIAIHKAQNFYDRVLDGYGDDSIGELGSAHLAVEGVSMLAAKVIEDARIGGSPLEKSTRYIYFDQKVNGEYLFYKEPILMTSAYRDIYLDSCNRLFETYSKLIPPLTAIMETRFPKEASVSTAAYTASVRAKVLDCLRGVLPASTLTNLGLFGNGRFFEQLIHKLHCSSLAELQEIGKRTYDELFKIIPSFVRRASPAHRTHQSYAEFYEAMNTQIALITHQLTNSPASNIAVGPTLIHHDPECVEKIVAALLFPHCNKDLYELFELAKQLPAEETARILDAACASRETRRHKSPRALEHAEFTFAMLGDFGSYRDLQRHRLLTQEKQLLTCNYGFYIPDEIRGTEIEAPYCEALERAKEVYDTIACELPEEAQYGVPMAFRIRWYFHVNLRALQWMCELRSSAAGHPSYRHFAQDMARQVCLAYPVLERFFKFVDMNEYHLGRLQQESRRMEKQTANTPT